MVRLNYQNIANSYYEVKQAACGRQACSVMIMVAYEVDAMSSCKMLTQLLRSDNIAYTIRPVLNFDEVIHNFQSFLTEDIKSIFMINCGALYNIPKVFNLESGGDFRVFILDNHRPLHLANIYSKHSVVVFDDTFDPSGDYDMDSLPSEGSDLSGGLSSDSEGDSSSEEEDEEGMFDEEELQTEDIDAAFGQDPPSDEDAELDDNDNNEEDKEGDEGEEGNAGEGEEGGADEAEEADAEEEEEEEGSAAGDRDADNSDSEGESIHTTSTRSQDSNLTDPDTHRDRGERSGSSKRKLIVREGREGGAKRSSRAEREAEEEVQEEDEEVGEEEMLRQKEDDDEEEEEEVRIRGGRKRRSKEAEAAHRARERRQILQLYYQKNATYTAPTALMLIELLSVQLGSRQMPTDVVWQAVLGVTYQYSAGHLPEGLYRDYCQFLKTQFGDALRTGGSGERNTFSVRAADETTTPALDAAPADSEDMLLVPGSENGYVEEANEYRFHMYRHWSLYDAMFHSPYVAAKLNVWNQQGTAKLEELLAKIGVPLQQCRQAYQYMSPLLRNHFAVQMADENVLQMYNLTNPGVTFKSFYRYNAFKNPVAASDIVHAVSALTELYGTTSISTTNVNSDGEATDPTTTNTSTNSTKVTSIEAFYDAYSCLGMRSDDVMNKGIKAALDLQRTIVKKASAMLDGHSSIHRAHRLYYAYLSKTSSSGGSSATSSSSGAGADIEHSFGRPMVLAKLGQYIMDIKRNLPKKQDGWTGSALYPLILFSEKSDGTFLVVGISPLTSVSGGEALTEEQEHKLTPLTNFREFFKLAGNLLGAPVRNISFDSSVVEVRKEDAQDFLGALDDSLRKATK